MSNPYQSPHGGGEPPQYPPGSQQGDATGGVIPYKNPNALLAYYFSLGTLFCCFTPLPLGMVPVVMGIMGLRARAKNPAIKGSVHAWIGIVLGGISTIVSLLVALTVVMAIVNGEFR